MRYLDVGAAFDMPTYQVFGKKRYAEVDVMVPMSPEDYLAMLPTADLIGFGGGADIHPSLYGCKDVASMVGHHPSRRDLQEAKVFDYALNNGIPMFGICRGAQFLCAMSGGKLVQHVDNHGGDHTIYTSDDKKMPMTSTHHQMMYPWDVKHKLLAWTMNRSKDYIHDIPDYVQRDRDPEVVFFEHTGALAVQGHPEWMDPNCKTVQQVREWIATYLNVNF